MNMDKDGKIFLISLSITTVILLYSTIVLFVIKESEKDKKISFQKRFEEVTIAKQDIETRLKEFEIANAEMKVSIRMQDEKIKTLSQRVEDERSQSAKSVSQLQQREFEFQSLKSKLAEEKAEKESLISRMEKISEERLELKLQLENMLKTKEEMDRKAKELAEKEGISLGTIVINQERK
ncbi:MAG: hypothetical protein WC592_07465 [Candidatus Omnitrophota bacterium]|nr:hypothetical protein [Candidatus Omnitrophota bacterium]